MVMGKDDSNVVGLDLGVIADVAESTVPSGTTMIVKPVSPGSMPLTVSQIPSLWKPSRAAQVDPPLFSPTWNRHSPVLSCPDR